MQRYYLYIASAMLLTTSASYGQNMSEGSGGKPLKDVRSMLKEVEGLASGASFEADSVASDSRFLDLSKSSHADFLRTIEDSLHDADVQLKILEFEQAALTPWERQAIAKVEPILKDAESNTELAMRYVDANSDPLAYKTYRTYTRSILQDCTKAAGILERFLKTN